MSRSERILRAPFGVGERAVEMAAVEMIDRGLIGRVIDAAITSGEADEIVSRLLAAGIVDRIIDGAVERGAVTRVIDAAIDEGAIDRVVEAALAAGLIERITDSPEFKAAITNTGSDLAGSAVTRFRRQAADTDEHSREFMNRVLQRTPTAPIVPQPAGFPSRLLAFVVDAGVVLSAGFIITAAVGMIATIFAKLDVATVLGVIAAIFSSVFAVGLYFVVAWTFAGQTLGMRLVGLRVIGPDGQPPALTRSLLRLGAAILGAIPFFAGYFLVLIRRDHRAFHDRIALTRVVYYPAQVVPELPALPLTTALPE